MSVRAAKAEATVAARSVKRICGTCVRGVATSVANFDSDNPDDVRGAVRAQRQRGCDDTTARLARMPKHERSLPQRQLRIEA